MKIPRNLKPGDRLWFSRTMYATVSPRDFSPTTSSAYFNDGSEDERRCRICAEFHEDGHIEYANYWCDTGEEVCRDTTPVIRVERVTSKPKRRKPTKKYAPLTDEEVHAFTDRRTYTADDIRDAHRAGWERRRTP